ncbi:hypothetical protein M0802_014850 [Mischocyttarus mexicanus]|nr:hypothetical protein M0802_014850 [Mischocyttarus mexicanus]
MFIRQRKSTIESESSDESVVSFRRKVRNRILSSSGSDTDESYASEDIEELLEELALDEEEKLNTADNSLENIQWNEFVSRQQSFPFTGKSGLLLDLPSDISPGEVFSLFLNETVISLLVTETNRYAEQKLLEHKTTGLAGQNKWNVTTSEEIKKFIGLMIWMGLVQTPLKKCCYELAFKFLNSKTHVVGTVRCNEKNMPSFVMSYPLKRGEMVAREDPNGIVVLKWKDVRNVRILSTKHPPIMTPSSNSTYRGRPTKMKPLAIREYNIGKSGIDRSDQMVSYATNLRKSIKWYRKLAIYLLLRTTIPQNGCSQKTLCLILIDKKEGICLTTWRFAKITWASLFFLAFLRYLRSSLEREAAKVITNLKLSAESFEIAWKRLVVRFDNKRLLVSAQVERLLDLPTVKPRTSHGLHRIGNIVESSLSAIEALGCSVEHWGPIVLQRASSALDARTREDWEHHLGASTEIPPYQRLLSFISAAARALDHIEGHKTHEEQQTS